MTHNALLYGFAVALLSGWLLLTAGALGALAGHPLARTAPHAHTPPAAQAVEVELVPELPAAPATGRGAPGCHRPRCAP